MRSNLVEKPKWGARALREVCVGLFGMLFLLALSGCDSGGDEDILSGEVAFQTAMPTYSPGAEVKAQLENGLSSSIGYNLCYLTLERRAGGDAWQSLSVSLGPTEDYGCLAILRELASGERAKTVAYLPDDLEGGTYRFATDIEVGTGAEGHQKVVTTPFEVAGPDGAIY